MQFTRITYSHYRDTANLSFKDNWVGIFYIPNQPKGNTLRYVQEIEDKNGREIVKSSVVQDIKTIKFMAPEPLVMAMKRLPMFSTVKVKVGVFDEETVTNVKFSVDSWLGGGAFAMCKLEYVTENNVTKATTDDLI